WTDDRIAPTLPLPPPTWRRVETCRVRHRPGDSAPPDGPPIRFAARVSRTSDPWSGTSVRYYAHEDRAPAGGRSPERLDIVGLPDLLPTEPCFLLLLGRRGIGVGDAQVVVGLGEEQAAPAYD